MVCLIKEVTNFKSEYEEGFLLGEGEHAPLHSPLDQSLIHYDYSTQNISLICTLSVPSDLANNHTGHRTWSQATTPYY